MGPCFDNYVIHALLSSHSDHCSLLLEDDSVPQRPQTFKFENVWLRLPGFNDDVHMAWNEPSNHMEPYNIMFHKLQQTSKELKKWIRGLFTRTKIFLHVALLLILHLDIAQEKRMLFDD
jgi:hypothetical protein